MPFIHINIIQILPLSVCSHSGESWISSNSTTSLWCVSDTWKLRCWSDELEEFRYFVLYLMIIISETKDSPNKSREKVPQPFGRSRIS